MRQFQPKPYAQIEDPASRAATKELTLQVKELGNAVKLLGDGFVPQGGEIVRLPGVTDHGDLAGLGDDDHPQYLLLAGRLNQTIEHSGAAGTTPTLQINNNSSNGNILECRRDDTNDGIKVSKTSGYSTLGFGIRLDADSVSPYLCGLTWNGTVVVNGPTNGSGLVMGTYGSKIVGWGYGGSVDVFKADFSGITADRTWTVQDDSGKIPVVVTPVDLTGQTGNIGTTTAFTTLHAGMYEISVYVKTTTAGAGGDLISAVTIGWNDGTAQTKNALEANHDLATLNAFGAPRVFTIYATSGQTITFATTCTIAGAPAYTLRIRIKPLG